jgi:hypothetical protein
MGEDRSDQPFYDELVIPTKDLPVEARENEERGVVTLTLSNDGAQCVPVFSTPFRAADYICTLLNQGLRAHYLSSSPLQNAPASSACRPPGATHLRGVFFQCPNLLNAAANWLEIS